MGIKVISELNIVPYICMMTDPDSESVSRPFASGAVDVGSILVWVTLKTTKEGSYGEVQRLVDLYQCNGSGI